MRVQLHNYSVKPKVLVVDDTPENIQIVVNVLRDLNVDIYYATNGPDALATIIKELPDLILLDVIMPGMNGFEVGKRVRALKEVADIPIVFVTARNDDESILAGFESGGQDFVSKPFNSIELRARILTQLELRFAYRSMMELNHKLQSQVDELEKTIADINSDLLFVKKQLKLHIRK